MHLRFFREDHDDEQPKRDHTLLEQKYEQIRVRYQMKLR